MKTKTITDHELSKIAEDWYNSIEYVNTGLKTAFAAGYRLAERQVNGAESENGKLPIPHVSIAKRKICVFEQKKTSYK